MSYNTYGISNNYNSSVYGSYSSYSSRNAASKVDVGAVKDSITNVKDFATELKSSIGALQPGSSTLFNAMSATPDKTDFLSAVTDSKTLKADAGTSYDVQIKQLAEAQKNTGSSLKATDKAIETATQNGGLQAGTNSFTIGYGGKNYSFDVKVTADDTNESLQKKLATAINNKGIGVTASISTDGTNKSLSLSAGKTGKNNGFTITDNGSGKLVSALGVGKVATQSKDAIFTVNNGAEKTSATNSVSIDNGITATLKKTTGADEKVKIGLAKDPSASLEGVKNLVKNLNSLVEEAKVLKANGNSYLSTQLSGAMSTYANSLKKIGITVGKDGNMSIDETKLKAAAASGNDLQKALGIRTDGYSSSSGFLSRLEQVSKKAATSPDQFLTSTTKNLIKQTERSRYDNYSQYSNRSSEMTYNQANKIDQWNGTGSLFNTLI